jgi:hypothetical protein
MWDESRAFRVARRAGMRKAPSLTHAFVAVTLPIVGLVFIVYELLSGQADAPAHVSVFFLLIALLFVVVFGTTGVRYISERLRMRRAWQRAARGEAVQVLTGSALWQGRVVGRYPVRTVVAPIGLGGRSRFVRLAFARFDDAARLPPGLVEIDLFDGPEVRGPARLRPHHGTAVWAFAARIGDPDGRPDEEPNAESDGWPDSDRAADPGWPGSDGDGGDGDGGE